MKTGLADPDVLGCLGHHGAPKLIQGDACSTRNDCIFAVIGEASHWRRVWCCGPGF